MRTDELVIGRNYAFRHTRGPDCPLLKVQLLDIVGRKGKVKVRFQTGPHPGLEEYVATRQLVARWSERRAVLRDEQREQRLQEHSRRLRDPALVEAAAAVLSATGEPGAGADPGVTVFGRDELQRILDRAGLETAPEDLHWLGYRDRRGAVHLPLDAVVELARAFAAAEPEAVTAYLDDVETELRLRGNAPGERWYHDYLRQRSPGFALAKQWAGPEQEAERLRREIARLRSLLSRAAQDLRRVRAEERAARLERALQGR